MDETSANPLKLRWPNAMFTLREIFYNGKLCVRCACGSADRVRENPELQFKGQQARPKLCGAGISGQIQLL
jgi:hypothetical protein